MRKLKAVIGAVALIGCTEGALATDIYEPAKSAAPQVEWEFGSRAWFSTGMTEYSIYTGNWGGGVVPGEKISKLTYDDLSAVSGELFFRGDFRSGLFIKGTGGIGGIGGGSLDDEDYTFTGFGSPTFPVGTKWSDTYSEQDGGQLTYFDLDLGYTFLQSGEKKSRSRLGAFIGYHYWNEQVDAYGVRCNPDDLGNAATGCAAGTVAVPYSVKVISNDITWSGVRLGLNGDVALTDRLKLSAEAAYIFADVENHDTHWLRGDRAGATDDSGSGDGVALEAILSYDISNSLSLGVGGRYWHATSDDATQRQHYSDGTSFDVPQKIESDRYGVFLQGSMKFGNNEEPLK